MTNMPENQGVVEVNYLKNPKVMYKFGYTDMGDANQRFSEETARIRRFANIPLGRDYNVRTRWSAWFTLEEAKKMEEMFKADFPTKNVWTDEFYNGITECRYMHYEEAETYIQKLKDQYPKNKFSYQAGYMKVYFVMLVRK